MPTLHALAIDVETTGLDPTRDAVVELAAVGLRIDPATGRPDARRTLFSSLVDPERDIPAAASAVHHLMAKDVAGQPRLPEALDALRAAVRDFEPTVLVAHNAAFDAGFLPGLAAELTPDDPRWVCTQRLAQHLWPLVDGFGLQVLRYARGLQDQVPGHDVHRAAFDAACCAVLLADACRALADTGRAVTPDLLRERTEAVPLLARVPFGRHRGQLWRDVPLDYCQWVLHKHRCGDGFAPEIVATAEAAFRGEYAVPPDADALPPC